MIDLSETLQGLRLSSLSWDAERASQVASNLARWVGASVDWDADAGESWVSVILGGRRVAMVSTTYPLAILEGGVSWDPQDSELVQSVIAVESFDVPSLRCSIADLGLTFGELGRFHSMNVDGFSKAA